MGCLKSFIQHLILASTLQKTFYFPHKLHISSLKQVQVCTNITLLPNKQTSTGVRNCGPPDVPVQPILPAPITVAEGDGLQELQPPNI